MEEFEPSSDAWNREWRSSNQVPMLVIGNGGVRAKFRFLELEMEEFEPNSDAWNRKWRSSSQVLTLGIGNGGVRAKFQCPHSNPIQIALVQVGTQLLQI